MLIKLIDTIANCPADDWSSGYNCKASHHSSPDKCTYCREARCQGRRAGCLGCCACYNTRDSRYCPCYGT